MTAVRMAFALPSIGFASDGDLDRATFIAVMWCIFEVIMKK